MIVYITMTIATLFFSYLLQQKIKIKTSPCNFTWNVVLLSLLAILPMFLTNGLMDHVGNDYINYKSAFDRGMGSYHLLQFEWGYVLINYLVLFFHLNFQWVYLITCGIAYTLLILNIMRYSENYAYSFLFFIVSGYFFLLGLNALRHFVALMIVVWAYQYIEKRKLISYMLCILLAGSFHNTAFLMIPFYFFLGAQWKASFYVLFSIVSVALYPIGLRILLTFGGHKAPAYVMEEGGFFEFNIIYLLTLFVPFAIITWNHKCLDSSKRTLWQLVGIGLLFAIIFSWFPHYKRIVYYFHFPAFLLLPQCINAQKSMRSKILILLLLLFVYGLNTLWSIRAWGVFPYESVLKAMLY